MYELVRKRCGSARRLLMVVGASGLAVNSIGASAQPIGDIEIARSAALGDPLPDRTIQFDGGVKAMTDLVYRTIPGYRPLHLDVYVSARRSPKPLIVYIHGGGWTGGHTRQAGAIANFPKLLAQIASRGFTVASVEYRLSGEAPFPAAFDDVRAAIRYLHDNARRYNIDPSRVGVWGGSAGGQLAELVALGCNNPALGSAAAPASSGCVQSAVAWYGVSDFQALEARPAAARPPTGTPAPRPENRYLACTAPCDSYILEAASPIAQADARDPPLLLIHGTEDRTVPTAQSQALYDKLKAAGGNVQLILISGVDHSFVGPTQEATRAATVKAVNATLEFFERTLQARPSTK